MRRYGLKEKFAIEYEMVNSESGYFELWVSNKAVCCFQKDNTMQQYYWDLSYIVDWLNNNRYNLLKEIEFPLPISARTSIDFLNKSNDFDSDDIDEFTKWFEKRQEWYFRHSWYSNRAGSYLAEVIFRRVNDKIEVEWDNTHLYKEIYFINPKGLYYVDIDLFQQVVDDFILDFTDKKSTSVPEKM